MTVTIIPPGPVHGTFVTVKIEDAEVLVWLTPSELSDLYLALTDYYAQETSRPADVFGR